jgi:hypothetical protein
VGKIPLIKTVKSKTTPQIPEMEDAAFFYTGKNFSAVFTDSEFTQKSKKIIQQTAEQQSFNQNNNARSRQNINSDITPGKLPDEPQKRPVTHQEIKKFPEEKRSLNHTEKHRKTTGHAAEKSADAAVLKRKK